MEELKVPVKTDEGTKLEPWNPQGQSDGSVWTSPKDLIPKDHEHFFKLSDPSSREARCECGLGGTIFPHKATIGDDGHIYNLKGEKII